MDLIRCCCYSMSVVMARIARAFGSMHETLTGTDRRSHMQNPCHSDAQREVAAARRASERARREAEELSMQQLPKTKAEFQVGHQGRNAWLGCRRWWHVFGFALPWIIVSGTCMQKLSIFLSSAITCILPRA